MCLTLHEHCRGELSQQSSNSDLCGTLVSSLHRVKDAENIGESSDEIQKWPAAILVNKRHLLDVGYFVFQDFSLRREGEYCLKFSLFELQQ